MTVPNYKKSLPFLKKGVGKLWMQNSVKVMIRTMDNLSKDSSFIRRKCLAEEVQHKVYIPISGESIDQKYAILIRLITNIFEVKAIWIKYITDKGNVITTIRIYGYEEDIKSSERVISYLHYGLEVNRSRIMKQLRDRNLRDRRKARKAGKEIPEPIHARTQSNRIVDRIIGILISTLGCYDISCRSMEAGAKLGNIHKRILEREKLNYKYKTNSINQSIMAAYSRQGRIQLNRIL